MLLPGWLPVINPVKVALVIVVAWVRAKSSPVSVSNPKEVSGRDAVAILSSVLPVLKKNAPAKAGLASDAAASPRMAAAAACFIGSSGCETKRHGKPVWRGGAAARNAAFQERAYGLL